MRDHVAALLCRRRASETLLSPRTAVHNAELLGVDATLLASIALDLDYVRLHDASNASLLVAASIGRRVEAFGRAYDAAAHDRVACARFFARVYGAAGAAVAHAFTRDADGVAALLGLATGDFLACYLLHCCLTREHIVAAERNAVDVRYSTLVAAMAL